MIWKYIKDSSILTWAQLPSICLATCFWAYGFGPAAANQEDVEYELVRKYAETEQVPLFHQSLSRLYHGVLSNNYDSERLEEFLIREWETRAPSVDIATQSEEPLFVVMDLAGYILLGHRDGWVDYPIDEAARLLRDIAASQSETLPIFAIHYVSILKNDADAGLFKESARRPITGIFRSSIGALGRLCSVHGQKALEELRAEETDRERSTYILEIYDKYYGDRASPFYCRDT